MGDGNDTPAPVSTRPRRGCLWSLPGLVSVGIVAFILLWYTFERERPIANCPPTEVLELSRLLQATLEKGDAICTGASFAIETIWRMTGVSAHSLTEFLAGPDFYGRTLEEVRGASVPQDYLERAPSDWMVHKATPPRIFVTREFPQTWDAGFPEDWHFMLLYYPENKAVYGWFRWRG